LGSSISYVFCPSIIIAIFQWASLDVTDGGVKKFPHVRVVGEEEFIQVLRHSEIKFITLTEVYWA
jgi:hypothetical protein